MEAVKIYRMTDRINIGMKSSPVGVDWRMIRIIKGFNGNKGIISRKVKS